MVIKVYYPFITTYSIPILCINYNIEVDESMQDRICRACGLSFTPKTANQVYCDRVHYLKCPVCGRVYKVTDKRLLREGPKVCSQECINMLRRQGNKPGIKFKLCNPISIQPNDLALKLFHFLRSYHIKYEEAYSIDGYTYSCLLPDLNIVIVCSSSEFGKDKFIHRTYTEVASTNGFRCIHIYPFDNVGLIVQNLCPRIEVNLNDCTLYKLYPAIGENFLNKWHIQGSRRGQKLIVGIVKGQTLLQTMAFCSSRNPNYYVELARFCNIPGVSVPGGYAKMLEFATEGMGLSKIISYCDAAHGDIQDYKNMGLSCRGQTQVQKIWIKDSSFVKQVVQNYNRWTDEEMISRGYYLDYDCGQSVYTYE